MRRRYILAPLVLVTLVLGATHTASTARGADETVHYRGLLTQSWVSDTTWPGPGHNEYNASAKVELVFSSHGGFLSSSGTDVSYSGRSDYVDPSDGCDYHWTYFLGSGQPPFRVDSFDDPNMEASYAHQFHLVDCHGDEGGLDTGARFVFPHCELAPGSHVGDAKLEFKYDQVFTGENYVEEDTCNGTLDKVGQDPVAAITYRGTGTANQFTFDGSGSAATAPGATLTKYEWDFGDGTGTGSAVTHTFTSPVQHTVKLTVTDSNGKQGSTTVTLVPKLTITDVSVDPDPASPGDPATLHVTVRNDGGVQLLSVKPAVSVAPNTVATVDSGPTPASTDLAAGTQQTFDYPLNALDNGNATATVDASGTGPGGAVNAAQVKHDFSVAATTLAVDLELDPDTLGVGGTTKAKLTVTNNSGHSVQNLTPTLTAAPSSDATVGDPTGGDSILADGDSTTFTIPVTAKKEGTLTLTGKATAVVQLTGKTVTSPEKQAELKVGTDDTVTTTGDEKLPDWARTARICDVDKVTGGNQCTLRAAIELAEAWTELDNVLISFDIPSGGVPRIAPEVELPAIDRDSVTIDGTTQPGGWVELRGNASLETGLSLSGTHHTIRGLVIDGFSLGTGILVDGADDPDTPTQDLIAGNRIGTDPNGLTASFPNNAGIDLVDAGGTTVGGTAGTSASACTGDCNLLAGNDSYQLFGRGNTRGVKVQGNWVGVDATGMAALPSSGEADGIHFVGDAQRNAADASGPLIGGATSRAGLAPGNLVAAPGTGIRAVAPTPFDGAFFSPSIQGNLVGLGRDGSRAIGAGAGRIGIAAFTCVWQDNDFSYPVIGGGAPGTGNVVGGMKDVGIQAGAATYGAHGDCLNAGTNATSLALVAGNRVGTDVTGTRAVRNETGVRFGSLVNNLISGNGVGVSDSYVDYGNIIGLDADGEAALPNDEGTTAVREIGFGCTSQPCNVISGNRKAGVTLPNGASPDGAIGGTYIGTDITGTKAIPNGVGVVVPDALSLKIGGASGALATGKCDYPCNVIAGNLGAGIQLQNVNSANSPESVAGNLIGVGTDGSPLPNGGPAIDVVAGSGAGTLTIGGDAAHGNVIMTTLGFPGVLVEAQGDVKRLVTIQTNRFRMLGGQISPIALGTRNPTPPKIERVTRSAGTVHIRGLVFGAADPVLPPEQVELYAVRTCTNGGGAKPSNPLDGEPLQIVPASKADGSFSADVPVTALGGRAYVSALRTNQAGSTSRFAACVKVA